MFSCYHYDKCLKLSLILLYITTKGKKHKIYGLPYGPFGTDAEEVRSKKDFAHIQI